MTTYSPDPSNVAAYLVVALKRLSAPCEEQVSILEGIGVPVDELALDFDSAVHTLWVLSEAGLITGELVAPLNEINGLLSAISGEENASYWTVAALCHEDVWNEVRQRSQDVLRVMSENEALAAVVDGVEADDPRY
ncbi:hypothetical protein [Sinosporangium siamense]|uniref:Uncharacterized protein n=1 Tax=Sinosporangium siamense TaxID=1367973 RepID=A0A919RNP7_9ACTN|nr:hypothetical protein [Sinosporangium siamense]GII96507.1 hypothetical protein Ssi02_67380 [Sinosporangium siamense]